MYVYIGAEQCYYLRLYTVSYLYKLYQVSCNIHIVNIQQSIIPDTEIVV